MSNLLHILQCVYNCNPENILKEALNRYHVCLEPHYYTRSNYDPCIFDNDLNGMCYPYCSYCPYNADRDFNDYTYHVVMGGIGYRETKPR